MKAYTEFVDFIVSGMPPEQILRFQASEETRARVRYLLGREKQSLISGEEKNELEDFEQFEHIIRMAKARLNHNGAGQ